jgi:hypothetical protein
MMMDKQSFQILFERVAAEALSKAKSQHSKDIPDDFLVELHGGGVPGKSMPAEEALDILYIDQNHFFLCIDVGVKAVRGDKTILFVRASGHEPGAFKDTWHFPTGYGPFNVIVPYNL